MRWRSDRWQPYQPRPKVAKLSAEQLGRLRDTAARFVARSKVLSALVPRVELTRGRLIAAAEAWLAKRSWQGW